MLGHVLVGARVSDEDKGTGLEIEIDDTTGMCPLKLANGVPSSFEHLLVDASKVLRALLEHNSALGYEVFR